MEKPGKSLIADQPATFLSNASTVSAIINSFNRKASRKFVNFGFQVLPMWWIYALLSAFFAALTAIFAKVGVKDVNSDLATAIRTVVILVIAWAIAFFRGGTQGIGALSKHNLLFLCLSGIATGLSWVFYFKALQLGKVSQVAPVDKLSVALAIVLSVLFLGEVLTWKTAAGAGLIIAGTLVLIL